MPDPTQTSEHSVGLDSVRWAIDGGVVRTNAGSAKRSWMGIEDLQLLLAPGALVEALDVFAAFRTESEGRAAIRLASVPTQLLIRRGPGLVVGNAADYAITVDAERGIVVRYEAFIAGRPATRHTISDLILESPVPNCPTWPVVLLRRALSPRMSEPFAPRLGRPAVPRLHQAPTGRCQAHRHTPGRCLRRARGA